MTLPSRIVANPFGWTELASLPLADCTCCGFFRSVRAPLGLCSFSIARSPGLDELADADLVAGADGVNSVVRRDRITRFGATVDYLTNRFAWFGATKQFDTLTQTFRQTKWCYFNVHHYRDAAGMSTFVVEVDQETFSAMGMAKMSEAESGEFCERTFSEGLDAYSLIANK